MTSEREAARHLKPLMTHLSFWRNVGVWERDRRKMRRAQSVWVCVTGAAKGGCGGEGLVDPMCKSFTENTRPLQVVQEHSRVSGIFMLNSDFLFTFKSQNLSSEFDFFFFPFVNVMK